MGSSSSKSVSSNPIQTLDATGQSGFAVGQSGGFDNQIGNSGTIVKGTFTGDNNNQGMIIRGSNNVLSDHGAIDSAFDFAGDIGGKALASNQAVSSKAMDQVTNQTSTVANYMRDMAGQVGAMAKAAQDAATGTDNKKLILWILGGATLAAVAVVYLVKVKK